MTSNLSDNPADHAPAGTVAERTAAGTDVIGIRGTLMVTAFLMKKVLSDELIKTLLDMAEAQQAIWATHTKPEGVRMDFMFTNRELERLEPEWGSSPEPLYLLAGMQVNPKQQQARYQFGFLVNPVQNSITPIRELS